MANGVTPLRAVSKQKKFVHCFCLRDKNTGASDGEYVYFYGDDEETFMDAFHRICNISPVLKFGNFSVEIIKPRVLPNLNMDEMPNPLEYEQVINTHCAYTNLTKS